MLLARFLIPSTETNRVQQVQLMEIQIQHPNCGLLLGWGSSAPFLFFLYRAPLVFYPGLPLKG